MKVVFVADDGQHFASEEACREHEGSKARREEARRAGRMKAYWDSVSDLPRELLYYARKESEDLTREDVHELIASGDITIAGTVEAFRSALVDSGFFVEPAVFSSATREEPEPAPGFGDVWAEIIEGEEDEHLRVLYAARREFGIRKYGVPLQRRNGRDARTDLLQEVLDGIAYARLCGFGGVEEVLRGVLVGMVGRGVG